METRLYDRLMINGLFHSICLEVHHMMDKRKSFVFSRQYRNCFSLRVNALMPGN